jgi:hypothetical protein
MRSLVSLPLNSFDQREDRLVDELLSATVWPMLPDVSAEASTAASWLLSAGVDRTSGWGWGADWHPAKSIAANTGQRANNRISRRFPACRCCQKADDAELIPGIAKVEKT